MSKYISTKRHYSYNFSYFRFHYAKNCLNGTKWKWKWKYPNNNTSASRAKSTYRFKIKNKWQAQLERHHLRRCTAPVPGHEYGMRWIVRLTGSPACSSAPDRSALGCATRMPHSSSPALSLPSLCYTPAGSIVDPEHKPISHHTNFEEFFTFT